MTTTETTVDTPSMVLRAVGVVALVAMVAIDAWTPAWDPEPWSYLASIPLVVWGPPMAGALARKILGR